MDDYEVFKVNVLKLTGIDLNSYKERQMKRRLDFMLERTCKRTYDEYFKMIKESSDELEKFKAYITINVSEFFRNYAQWEILEKKIIPYLLNIRGSQTLNIWSAACSTGDEPYSVAMLLLTKYPSLKFNILATDIDEDIIRKAKEGEYSLKSIEKIPDLYIKSYFIKTSEDLYKISDGVKKFINFKRHDLIREPYFRDMDLIICRNVVIYFTEEVKDDMYRKFSDVMQKDRVLFIGNTEQIINSSKFGFECMDNFFYKKK